MIAESPARPAAPAPGRYSPDEWQTRVDLAACYRLVAHYGWDDLIFTHISARVPGPDHHFLINPYGLMFDEITASSLVKVDLDANLLEHSDYDINPAGFTIHSAVHAAREDARCVMHLHTVAGTAVATHAHGLLPLNQTAMTVAGKVAYHDYEGIALDHSERPRLVADLGDKSVMLLRNHGTLTVGPSVASAFLSMYFLERACQMQVATLSGGAEVHHASDAVIALVDRQSESLGGIESLVWSTLIRRLDKLDPSFRN
ncbi:MAG: class II aldolase/adducin family protein [Candidatus Eremiobacteraeota bacterium]|nr:class II aldolase/adducin family protein [Candidatus Eremiobacteraeota bacterium]